jgi:hypothetical protein
MELSPSGLAIPGRGPELCPEAGSGLKDRGKTTNNLQSKRQFHPAGQLEPAGELLHLLLGMG